MKPNLEYEYRPHTRKAILGMFAASGVVGLLVICGLLMVIYAPPRSTENPGPRRVGLGTLILESVTGREAGPQSAIGSAFIVMGCPFAILLGYTGVTMCREPKQRIALLPTGILLPSAETPTDYGRVHFLTVKDIGQGRERQLEIIYDLHQSCILYESHLTWPGAFNELHAELKRRTGAGPLPTTLPTSESGRT